MGAMTKIPENETARASDAKGGEQERIAKVLARAGLCSRREAEDWVAAGRVAVDGVVLTTPAVTVGPGNRITVDGKPLPTRERTRLWLFHKPRGLVTTTSDPEGRPTVFSVLPDDMPRVITIGRLDINTEGLLLLTNDGGLARVLELPSTGWLRRYRVRAYGEVDQAALDALKEGVSIDGIDYGPIDAVIDRVQGSNIWLVLGLREGKNREVKRVLAAMGLTVNRLIRISFGPFQLADLEEGEIREIRGRVLRDQLGKRLVAESGADFEAPLVHHIHGQEDEDDTPKRRIKGFTPAGESDERGGRDGRGSGDRPRGRTPRTKMEFVGSGERRRDDKGEGRGERGDRPYRSEGFRGRPGGAPKSAGFRDRPQGEARGEGRSDGGERRYRSEGYHDGGNRSAGFRDRGGEGRPRSEGFRGRPGDDRPRSEGFRDREMGGGRSEGGRSEGGRSEGGRSRPPRDERPRGEGRGKPGGFGDRPRGERGYRSEGMHDGGHRSAGFRDHGMGAEGRSRSEGFRDRPEGAGRSAGFRDRPEGSDKPRSGGFKARPEGASFGPRGPRGMSPGGKKGMRDAGPEGRGGHDGPKGRGPRAGGPKGAGPKGAGPKGPRGPGSKGPRSGGGRGGPRGGRS
jgi:23S rRNA pseudouridine2605 synthase